MRTLAPQATFTCCVPFPLPPLIQRFPSVAWLPCDETSRAHCIGQCDIWLGLGGSPFQSALSRWFLDHLVSEAALCARQRKPMFYLGVGVQNTAELADPDLQRLCAQATAIWTRDPASAARLAALPSSPPVESAADLAHLYFRETPPPPALPGRLTLVANFDYGAWPGQGAFLRATAPGALALPVTQRVWLAQESRDLPGAERALHAALAPSDQALWALALPDLAPTPAPSLDVALGRWPSGEWLVTARYHAALAGAWAGSKVSIVSTNEKLRAAAHELSCPMLSLDATGPTVTSTLQTVGAPSRALLTAAADRAHAACAAFVRAASRFTIAPRL
ncbi:MAG: hypothetical protein NTV51_09305 [Verrucomicrobia bacterium]|nr:hypothetical protein [Verrucomicrobiota bacterium]